MVLALPKGRSDRALYCCLSADHTEFSIQGIAPPISDSTIGKHLDIATVDPPHHLALADCRSQRSQDIERKRALRQRPGNGDVACGFSNATVTMVIHDMRSICRKWAAFYCSRLLKVKDDFSFAYPSRS